MSNTDQNQTATSTQEAPGLAGMSPVSSAASPPPTDHRESAEWDASKVPPSRFQKRKGSIYAVPASRDGHIDSNYAHKFHEKHAEKGYPSGRRSSSASK
ncbi:hypothetical protein NKR23_g2549 [Pleurostoma richardsiae]|uniref:Uncharacterized protein n=1 Tax=Pleurostoma richardsiae TaxID=41990 RepID=A0AA38VIU8_9PEZI|nr:hypothetical protein NKR23_g2549 [Pleurostoma richardsiae]